MTSPAPHDERDADARELDRIGARTRAHRDEILRIARNLPEGPADQRFADHARSTLDALLPARSVRWRWVAAAAAVLGACAWGLSLIDPGRGDSRPPIELGTGAIEGVAPLGPDASFERFEWRLRLGTAASYTLVVATRDGSELFRATDLAAPDYRPTAAQLELIQGAVRWRVQVHDAAGDVVDSATFDASR